MTDASTTRCSPSSSSAMARILRKPWLLQRSLPPAPPRFFPLLCPTLSLSSLVAPRNGGPSLPVFSAAFRHQAVAVTCFRFSSPPSCVAARFPRFPLPVSPLPGNDGRLPLLPSAGSSSSSPLCCIIVRIRNSACQSFSSAPRLPYSTFPYGCFISSSYLSPSVINRNSSEIEECKYRLVESPGCKIFGEAAGAWLLMHNRRWQVILLLIGGAIALIYFTHLEVVPCTYRKHFILIPPELEAQFGQESFNALKNELKLQILPSFHPDSIRVQRIAKDVLEAVTEGAKECDSDEASDMFGKQDAAIYSYAETYNMEGRSSRLEVHFEEAVSDYRNRNSGLQKRRKTFTKHLERIQWEILVVDAEAANAFCLAGGKIVVFTGFLKHFPSNEEIATILGHEVAHVVARHPAEQLTRKFGLALIELAALLFFYASDFIRTVSNLLFHLPFSRRMELEADQIGLLVMAAAGYDPRVAPALYEKISELAGVPEVLPSHATHPSAKMRVENLINTATMEEAMRIYRDKVTGRSAYRGYLL